MSTTPVSDKIAPGKAARAAQGKSTQTHLRIGEIHDNVLVLKNGGLRAVLKATSINFNLKSEEEQNSIISGYQNFLNSSNFRSKSSCAQKLDIDDYIDSVRKLGDKQANKLLQEQTYEYADYIQKLVEYADIMAKEFYVIVPMDPLRSSGQSRIQGFLERLKPKDNAGNVKKRHAEFEELNKLLTQRVNTVEGGLNACGLQITQASTVEIINLFYQSYNPISSRSVKFKDSENNNLQANGDLRF